MSFQNCTVKASGVNPAAYHSTHGKRGTKEFIMSPSALKKFAECPAEWIAEVAMIAKLKAKIENAERADERKYWKRMLEALDADTRGTAWGRLVDARLFTPDLFQSIYAVRPTEYDVEVLECPECGSVTDSKTCRKCKVDRVEVKKSYPWSSRATHCQEWIEAREEEGLEVIAPYTVEAADMAISRMMDDPVIKKAIDCSDKQVHVVGEWHDKATGLVIPVQCLLDLVPRLDTEYVPGVEMMWPKVLGDLKTSTTADIIGFSRKCQQFGWHIQAAFDLKLYTEATKEDRTSWIIIGQKNSGVWQPFKRLIAEDFLSLGTAAYQRMLSNYCWCLKNNKWPDFDDTDESISGFGQAAPDPWMAEREQFAPKYVFEDAEGDPEPFEAASDDVPT